MESTLISETTVPLSSGTIARRLGTYAVVLAVWVSLLIAVDPSGDGFGMNAIPLTKYLPVEFAVLGAGFYLLSPRTVEWPATVWMLGAFAILVLGGSVVTIGAFHAHFEDSFLGRGLGVLAVFPAYEVFHRPAEERILRLGLRGPFVATTVIIVLGLLVWRAGFRFVDQPHIYHEEIFIPVCCALGLYAEGRGQPRWSLVTAFWMAGLLSLKYTGILASTIVGVFIMRSIWRKAGRSSATQLRRVILVQALVWATVLTVAIVVLYRDVLPSGSPAVRAFTYLDRLKRFSDHPITGTGFTGTPLLSLFRRSAPINLVIPSHSDILDMLAFGGLVGAMLFAVPALSGLRRSVQTLPVSIENGDWLRALAAGTVAVFLVEMVFNPVWNQPNLMVLFDVALACMLSRRSGSVSR